MPGPESKLETILRICRRMNSERDLDRLLDLLAEEAGSLLHCERISIFLLDADRNQLWSKVAMGLPDTIRLDSRSGIVGAAIESGQTIHVPDAYADPRFNPTVDARTGYRTRSILAEPLQQPDGKTIGVLQALNKIGQPTFDAQDARLIGFLAGQAAVALQTAEFIAEINRSRRELEHENAHLWREATDRPWSGRIVGSSERIQAVNQLIQRIKDSSVNVLIGGESGTGKELAARAVHFTSLRARKPLIALNCAALPETLVESELFGIERGVATGVERRIGHFEAANGGTLFLDEIGDLSLTAQAKILRALQDQRIERVGGRSSAALDVRVIAATNKDLESEIKAGRFREDLYYRLKVVSLRMPSLREIPGDIPALAHQFLADACREQSRPRMQFTPGLLQRLQSMPWPGNARQLQNEVRRLVACSSGSTLVEDDGLDSLMASHAPIGATSGNARELPEAIRLQPAVDQLERRLIREALERSGNNQSKAAQALGISRQGLINKLKRHRLLSQ